jgi:putative endonuclease
MNERKKNMHRVHLGKWGEDCALAFLEQKGYSFVERNLHFPHGEIDLVMKKGNTVIFVEVKTRNNVLSGFPESGMTDNKMQHMDDSIHNYLEKHPEITDNWRVDVISVIGSPGNFQQPEIEWWQNEF